jgi:hypothetical protein
VDSSQLVHLGSEFLDRRRQGGPIKSCFAEGDDVSLARRVKHDLDPFHRAILLKANNGVNRACQTSGRPLERNLRPAAHSRRNNGVM